MVFGSHHHHWRMPVHAAGQTVFIILVLEHTPLEGVNKQRCLFLQEGTIKGTTCVVATRGCVVVST